MTESGHSNRGEIGSFGALTRVDMIAGLKKCMRCYWSLEAQAGGGLSDDLRAQFRVLEREILSRLDSSS